MLTDFNFHPTSVPVGKDAGHSVFGYDEDGKACLLAISV